MGFTIEIIFNPLSSLEDWTTRSHTVITPSRFYLISLAQKNQHKKLKKKVQFHLLVYTSVIVGLCLEVRGAEESV
jgi:thiosulfate reductase cytochrome b subunit